ncbi:uncharacterized protein [Palaemon carinicauda]|uniref:uncharacterized protein n=1 Tax=Palaemon carinicauda TaxID=392227 RepID=UPI0035B5EF58
MEQYNVIYVKTTPYKPSSNGALERVNCTIGELLRVISGESRKWDQYLSQAVLSYNHSHYTVIGCTPAENKLKGAHNVDSTPLLSAETRDPWAERHPRYKPFKEGSLVLKKVHLLGHLLTNKLIPRFEVVFRVTKVHENKVTYELQRLPDGELVRAHHIQLKAWFEPPVYLRRHFLWYPKGPDPVIETRNSRGLVEDSPTSSEVSESSSSSSDGDSYGVAAVVASYLLSRDCNKSR